MASTHDNYYDNQPIILGLGLNSMTAAHDSFYGSQQGMHGLVKNRKDGMLTTPVNVTSTSKNSSENNGQQSRKTAKFIPEPLANVAESSAPNGNAKQHGTDTVILIIQKIRATPFTLVTCLTMQLLAMLSTSLRNLGLLSLMLFKGFGFGFVEYESSSSAHKAVEASPIRMGDYEAYFQEKKTNTRVFNEVVTYTSDGFRGRGNFSLDRGYGRNYYGRRGGDHGNDAHSGDIYHRGYQNRGSSNPQRGAQ